MIELRQLDTVVLLTTKNITYLSAKSDGSINPNGQWQIAAVVGGQLLLTKQLAVIRVPPQDVKLIHKHNLTSLDQQLKELINGLPVDRDGRESGIGFGGGEEGEETEKAS